VNLRWRFRTTNTRAVGLASTRTTLAKHSKKAAKVEGKATWTAPTERHTISTRETATRETATEWVALWGPSALALYVTSHVIYLPLPVIREYIVGPRNCLEIVLLTALIWVMLHGHTLVSTAYLLLIHAPLNAKNPVEILLCAGCRHLCFLEKSV
jgi:hypothetical protein